MLYTDIDGLKIRYDTRGKGADVLLLHGWGGKLESFAPTTAALSESFRVTALDFPAFGESARPKETWGVEEYADFTQKFIRKAGIAPCHIVAHSFGGRVTLVLANRWPDLIKKIVITGGAGLKKPPTLSSKMRQAAVGAFKSVAPEGLKDTLRGHFGSTDYKTLDREMQETFKKVINQDLRPFLPGIRASTLLVWGDQDTETPLSFGQIMEKEIPDAGLAVFEGCGHYAYLEQNARFNKVAAHFFAQ